jgi:hypothetical protein
MRRIVAVLGRLLLEADPAMSSAAPKLLVAGVLVVGVATAVVGFRRNGLLSAACRTVALLGLLAIAILNVIGILIPAASYWDAFYPRLFSHVGVLYASALVLAVRPAERTFLRPLALTVGCIVLLSLAARTSAIHYDEQRMNARDRTAATLILARLHGLPDSGRMSEVVFVGRRAYPDEVPTARETALNRTAFDAPWSNTAVLSEVSGFSIKRCFHPDHMHAAQTYCATAGVWPGPKAVTTIGQIGVVCLPH